MILLGLGRRKLEWQNTEKKNGLDGIRLLNNLLFQLVCLVKIKNWPGLFIFVVTGMQNGSHLWQLALQKRKEGRCPLEPGEVAVILRAMGYPVETQIYVASGQVYGGQNRMAPLRNMFPNLVFFLIFIIYEC